MKKRVVVTGLGVVSAIGQRTEEFWSNCLLGKSKVTKIPDHWFRYADFNSTWWSPLPDIDYSEYGITRLEKKQLDKSGLMALASAFQALDSAGLVYTKNGGKRNTYSIQSIDNKRAGVFMGTGVGGISSFASCFSHQILSRQKESLEKLIPSIERGENVERLKEVLNGMVFPRRFNPFGVAMTMPNACSGNIGIRFNLTGNNNTFCSACAAGTVAIGHGFKAVRAGEIDLALVGGVEYVYDEYGALFLGFDAVRTLANGHADPDKVNRPFDRDRSGFLFSEGGGAVLIIEEWEHARKRGAPILAEIVGYAENCDAYNIMMMENSGHKIMRMIEQALADSGLSAKDVDYVNTHGTGTQLNDEIESRVIEEVFGKGVLLNSTKSLIGHTLGASGAIEAVVTILSIYQKTTHVCRNLDDPIRDLNFVTGVDSYPIDVAISQSFGFGGHNAALVFREYR